MLLSLQRPSDAENTWVALRELRVCKCVFSAFVSSLSLRLHNTKRSHWSTVGVHTVLTWNRRLQTTAARWKHNCHPGEYIVGVADYIADKGFTLHTFQPCDGATFFIKWKLCLNKRNLKFSKRLFILKADFSFFYTKHSRPMCWFYRKILFLLCTPMLMLLPPQTRPTDWDDKQVTCLRSMTDGGPELGPSTQQIIEMWGVISKILLSWTVWWPASSYKLEAHSVHQELEWMTPNLTPNSSLTDSRSSLDSWIMTWILSQR